MADGKTQDTAPKAETPAAKAAEAPKAVEKAADAAVKAAEKAAPAPAKEAAGATAAIATAPARAAARTAKAARKTAATRAAKKPARAKAAPARRAAAKTKTAAPKRRPAPAAGAAGATTSNRIDNQMNEGTRTMKNEAKQAADRIQAVFGDVNERAKTVIERNTRFAEELNELAKGNVEAMAASTKAAAKGVEALGQEVAELSRKSFEDASAALKGFADVKSPTDFFRLQSDFARSQFDMIVAESSRLSETVIKVAGDVAQPITNRYSVAAERVRSAVAF